MLHLYRGRYLKVPTDEPAGRRRSSPANGEYLYQQYQRHGDDPPPFDIPVVAKQIQVDEAQVLVQGRVLKDLGLAAEVGQVFVYSGVDEMAKAPQAPVDLYHLHLSVPDGIRWAAAGFPPIAAIGSSHVNVTLNLRVEIQNTINEARSSDVSRELLEQFEARIRRVEEEMEKPDGRFEAVKEMLDTANQSKDLLGPAIKFLYRHWDRVQQLVDSAADVAGGTF